MRRTHLVYISSATTPATPESVQNILDRAIINNQAKNVTGLLIYRMGYFLQLLEGDVHDVGYIVEKIKSDTRHSDVKSVLSFYDDKRLFPQWKMGLITDPEDAERLTMVVNDLKTGNMETTGNASEKAIEVLKSFSRKYSAQK